MRDELADSPLLLRAPLCFEADLAGHEGGSRLQRAIMQQLEDLRYAGLGNDVMTLNEQHPARLAWNNENKSSTQFINSHPNRYRRPSPAEFREAFATYLGAESPGCRALPAGASIPSDPPRRLDRWGFQLDNAVLKNNGWKEQHDTVDRLVFNDLLRAGVFGRCQPRDLFREDILQSARSLHGIIPDAMLRIDLNMRGRSQHGRALGGEQMFLFDTKCIHAGSTHYSTAAQRVRCGAVERRAAKVAVDYEANARRKDEKYNRTQRGEVGPVLARLRTYPPVQGVVWGAYGESNKLVETLIGVAARRTAERKWRSMGARGMAEAVSWFSSLYWRRWGCAATFAQARMRVSRLSSVGRTHAEEARMTQACLNYSEEDHFGAVAFEADEAGHGVERMARAAV